MEGRAYAPHRAAGRFSGAVVSSPEFDKEMAHLREQIERARQELAGLRDELRLVDAELAQVSAGQPRFDALRSVCDALGQLTELKVNELFWEGADDAGRVERARGRIAAFEAELKRVLDKQASVKEQIRRCCDELTHLDYEVRDAHDREVRREQEYVIEREISPLPDRAVVMPWSRNAESERRFRKVLLVAMLAALFLGTVIPRLDVPAPIRPIVAVVPDRLVSMLKKEPPKLEPHKEAKKPEKDLDGQEREAAKEEQPKPVAPEEQVARKKAESSGVLAFKESLRDLIQDEPPTDRLGAKAHLSGQPAAGRGGRSLVALPSTGARSSGGIGSAGINRTIGPGEASRVDGVNFARVESAITEQAENARPLGSGPDLTPSRTDEEIQIVFDRYKAALYRMYNVELRKNPTLRGKIVLRLTIEPGGEVSACSVQSSDLQSPELVAQIVERVKRFNFGPKEKVSKTTILYPIEFLPGG